MREEIVALVRQARNVGGTQAAIELMEEAIRLADSANEHVLGLAARRELMQMCRHLLRSALLASTFAATVAKFDESPEEYAEFNPLVEYEWVIGLLSNFPEFTLERRDEMLADMQRRVEAAGRSPESVHWVRWAIFIDFADPVMAEEARAALIEAGYARDRSFLYYEVLYRIFLRDDANAVECGERFLHGRERNDDICSNLLLSLMQLGRLDEAESVYRSLRAMRKESVYYWPYGERMKYLSLTGRVNVAIRHYETFQDIVVRHGDPMTQLYFYTDMLSVIPRLRDAGHQQISLSLPRELPFFQEEGVYDVDELIQFIRKQADELAERFDVRNGNDYYKERIAAQL